MQEHLTYFRQQIDDFMGYHPESPLTAEQKLGFEGLPYYEYNPDLVFERPLSFVPRGEPLIEMGMSTGETRPYRRWATVAFEVDGEPAELTIYSDPWGESLFLPFKDGTNGEETYGAGRYLDNHRPGLQVVGGNILLDFNFCYNPYCAYNSSYSCPLPPRENWLDVLISAGEKHFTS